VVIPVNNDEPAQTNPNKRPKTCNSLHGEIEQKIKRAFIHFNLVEDNCCGRG